MSSAQIEGKVYLRFTARTGTFDFKLEMAGKPVPMGNKEELTGLTHEQLMHIRAGMTAAPGGQEIADLLDWLIIEAKKDPEGRYVSASSAKVAEGQATVGK